MVKQICFRPLGFFTFLVIGLAIVSYVFYTQNTVSGGEKKQHFINVTLPPQKTERDYPLSYPGEIAPRMSPHRERDEQFRKMYPHFTDLPINIHNTPYDDGLYQRLGVLLHDTNQEYRLPLYGKREYPNSSYYNYYAVDHSVHQNKIELDAKRELFDGDEVPVPGYPGVFKVYFYHDDAPRYHPNVIGGRGGPLPFRR